MLVMNIFDPTVHFFFISKQRNVFEKISQIMATQHNCQYLKERNSGRSLTSALLSFNFSGTSAKSLGAVDRISHDNPTHGEKSPFASFSTTLAAIKTRKESVLRSYIKALDAGDYETAGNLDTHNVAKEDLANARREAFARKIDATLKSLRAKDAATHLEKIRVIFCP